MAEENEKKDSSAVGKINSAYRSYKNAKRAYNTVKAARTGMMAAEGISAVATSEVWVPVVIVGLIIVVIVIILFGGVSGVKGGDLSNGGTNEINPNILTQLENDLVITGSGADSQTISDIKKIMAIPYQSSTYRNLITVGGKYKVNIIVSKGGGCGRNTTGGPGGIGNAPINLMQFDCSFTTREKILIHETGHVIVIRGNAGGFPLSTLSSPSNADSGCYLNRYLRTYSYKASGKGPPENETFPEALSDNIIPHPTDTKYGDEISNYPTTCANTYNWIKTHVYGGFDFFAPHQSSAQDNTTSTTNTSPSKNTCNGHYDIIFHRSIYDRKGYQYISNPNFGDPNCTMITAKDRDNLHQLILTLEPNKIRANSLFTCVIKWESSYIANNYAESSSGNGAYGLFQMNPKSAGRKYDIGDVVWEQQVKNAINHIRPYASLKAYWQAARAYNCPG